MWNAPSHLLDPVFLPGAQAVWEAKMAAIRADEQEALDEAALPLRTFLMRHVMPTLTEV